MKRDTRILAAVLAFISTAILSASLLCSWAIALGASSKWRLLFRVLCHGMPQRAVEFAGVPMPICARCAAIYAGLAAGILLFWTLPVLTANAARRVLLIAVIPLAVDGLTQLAGLRESTNLIRIETGLLAGAAFAFWALTAVEKRVLTTS